MGVGVSSGDTNDSTPSAEETDAANSRNPSSNFCHGRENFVNSQSPNSQILPSVERPDGDGRSTTRKNYGVEEETEPSRAPPKQK